MKNYCLSCEITKRKETSINKLTFMELGVVSKDSHASHPLLQPRHTRKITCSVIPIKGNYKWLVPLPP